MKSMFACVTAAKRRQAVGTKRSKRQHLLFSCQRYFQFFSYFLFVCLLLAFVVLFCDRFLFIYLFILIDTNQQGKKIVRTFLLYPLFPKKAARCCTINEACQACLSLTEAGRRSRQYSRGWEIGMRMPRRVQLICSGL